MQSLRLLILFCLTAPLLAEGRLYIFSEEGKCAVLAAGREYKKLAESTLPSGIMATPAPQANSTETPLLSPLL